MPRGAAYEAHPRGCRRICGWHAKIEIDVLDSSEFLDSADLGCVDSRRLRRNRFPQSIEEGV